MYGKTNTSGFTIVELLIVIVVIAILAAVTVVAFNGVQNRANDSSTQASVSQIYKKLKLAEGAEELSPEVEDSVKINELLSNLGSGSYDTSKGYPVTIGFNYVYNEENQTNELSLFTVAAISKSGNVYYANDETAGVAQHIPDYSTYRIYYESTISYYSDYLASPEFPEEYRAEYEGYRDRAQLALSAVNKAEIEGKGLWNMLPRECASETEQNGLICVSMDMIAPVDPGSSYSFSGYVYDVDEMKWKARSGIYVL